MVLQENKIFCPAKQFGINHWILHKCKREQNGLTRSILHTQKRAEWYRSLNPEKKEKLLSGRAEWYKTLDPADEIGLNHKSKLIGKPIETQFNMT